MNEDEIRIVELPPMRVVCINGFGQEPEDQAFKKMFAWAKEHDLLEKPHRLFGFDNPVQTPGSPNRGYDVWMTVDEACKADGEASLIEFPGGTLCGHAGRSHCSLGGHSPGLAAIGQMAGEQPVSRRSAPVAGGTHRSDQRGGQFTALHPGPAPADQEITRLRKQKQPGKSLAVFVSYLDFFQIFIVM